MAKSWRTHDRVAPPVRPAAIAYQPSRVAARFPPAEVSRWFEYFCDAILGSVGALRTYLW
jgi:hypothetical protein